LQTELPLRLTVQPAKHLLLPATTGIFYTNMLKTGKILPDNNGAERAIRPIALWRNNSLFAGNEHGAERAALFFSPYETCKLNNIDPFEYLCDVYDRIHDCPANKLYELLPNQWKKATAATS
jgi:hypothetical protein